MLKHLLFEKAIHIEDTEDKPPTFECGFGLAWIGPCKTKVDHGCKCEKHADLKCQSCGATATHQCDETFSGLVCGCNLCNDCEHELTEQGFNVTDLRHCKKTEQKFTPWYTRNLTQPAGIDESGSTSF